MSNIDDDPTVELEPLSEAACADLMQSCESPPRLKSVSVADAIPGNSGGDAADDSEQVACEIQELRDELKFRDEMNGILQLGIDQQKERCQSLAEQVSNLQEINEELCRELEQSRQAVRKTHRKLEMAKDSEKALINNLKELGKSGASNEELLDQLKSSNAQIEHYKNQIAALRRESNNVAPTSTGRAPDVRCQPPRQTEDRWMLVSLDDDEADVHAVDDGIVTIGSSPDSDIRIQSQFISQHHAQLVKTHKGCVLGDLNSTNGTFINSRRINRRILRAGDIVTIGKHRFRYEKRSAESMTSDIKQYAQGLNQAKAHG